MHVVLYIHQSTVVILVPMWRLQKSKNSTKNALVQLTPICLTNINSINSKMQTAGYRTGMQWEE